MSLKILIQSDLHINSSPLEYKILEGRSKDQYPDVIVLAGDISTPCLNKLKSKRHGVIEWIAKNTPKDIPKVFIMGNHEYSHMVFDDVLDYLKQEEQDFKDYNIHFLHNSHIDIKGVRFLGTPLFGNLKLPNINEDEIRKAIDIKMATRRKFTGFCICGKDSICDYHTLHFGVNDDNVATRSRCGKFLKSHWFAQQNQMAKDFIKENLNQDPSIPKVVVTHWAPSLKSLDPTRTLSPIDAYWVSDFDHLIQQSNLWIHGHVHHFCDYKIGSDPNRGRVIANPRGWKGKDREDGIGFKENFEFILEI